jgi:tRNA-Thr(GGU) m(6)t(6)A37 methyltransferase TsaA
VGTIELKPQFALGLADLDGFSHALIVYAFHKSRGYKLRVVPYLDDVERGLFATRAPKRPNPIGITLVKILEVDRRVMKVSGVDMLDGTPLLDIKPHVPHFEQGAEDIRIGWIQGKLEGSEADRRKIADGRFHDEGKAGGP